MRPVRHSLHGSPKCHNGLGCLKIYNYKIREIGDMEIREAYDKLCENGILKEEFKIVERKGLTRALDFPTVFKTKWIKIVLRSIHDGSLW